MMLPMIIEVADQKPIFCARDEVEVDITIEEDKELISLPAQRWDDSKRPTLCTVDPDAGFSGVAPMKTIPVTIVGLKLK